MSVDQNETNTDPISSHPSVDQFLATILLICLLFGTPANIFSIRYFFSAKRSISTYLYLAITIRDNILIIALQILTNSEALKEWQLEAIPPGAVDRGRAGYWMKNMKSEKFKRRLSLAAEKVLSGSAERLDWTQPSVAPHAALLY